MRILILSSSSRHFPLDIQSLLKGHECHRLDSLNEFISSPLRKEPFLGVLEVGTTEDVDRALIAYEWAETVQPLAAARFLLLVGSKHISLQEKAGRFRGVEVAQLPLPPKNLLFKVELQLRVLANEKKPAEKRGFRAEFEGAEKERVLVVKGPGPKDGSWNNAGAAPQGKIRWRWINNPGKTESDFNWSVESRKAPEFDPATESWKAKEPDADLQCHRAGEEVYSAQKTEKGAAQPDIPPGVTAPEEGSAPAARPEKSSSLAPTPSPLPQKASPASTAAPSPEPKKMEGEKIEAKPATVPATEKRPQNTPAFSQSASPAQPEKSSLSPAAPPAKTPAKSGAELPTPSAHAPESKSAPPASAGPAAARPAPNKPPPAQAAPSPRPATATVPAEPKPASAPAKGSAPESGAPADKEKKESQARPISAAPSRLPPPTSAASPTPSPTPRATPGEKAEKAPRATPPIQAALEEPPPSQATRRPHEEKERKDRAPQAAEPKPKEPAKPGAAPAAASRGEAATAPSTPKPAPVSPSPSTELAKPAAEEKEPAPSRPAIVIQKGPARYPSQETVTQTSPDRQAPENISASSTERKESTGKIVISRNETSGAHQNLVRAGDQPDRSWETRLSGREETEKQDPQHLKMRLFHTMTLEELQDKNSSWHPVEGYRIYLGAEHRYYGMKDTDDLFPLWVYEGELAPEFLDLQKAWKFYDRLPVPYGSIESLPAPVRQFLLEIGKKKESETSSLSVEALQWKPNAESGKDEEQKAQAGGATQGSETKAAPAGAALPANKREWIFADVFRLLKKLLGL